MSPWIDEITLGADGAEVRRASEWLEATCRQHGVPQEPAERLALCLNEVLANILDHGGGTALSEPIRLLFTVRHEHQSGMASVTVSDAGMAFDPLSVPEKALPKTLDEASPDGMGMGIIRRCADVLHYRHEAGRNHLAFGARWNLQ